MSIRTLPMHSGREHRDGRLVEALRRRDADAAGASASRWTTRSRHSTLPRCPWSGVTSRAPCIAAERLGALDRVFTHAVDVRDASSVEKFGRRRRDRPHLPAV